MKMHEVDLDDGTILIPITKSKRPRRVPLTSRAVDPLVAWMEARFRWQPGDLDDLWISRWKGDTIPLSANAVHLLIERRRRQAGIHVSAHAFRRGAAAQMLRAGVPQRSVEQVCGWTPGSGAAAPGASPKTWRSTK